MVSRPLSGPFSQADATQQSTQLGVGTRRVHGKRRRKHSGQRREPSMREGCVVLAGAPSKAGWWRGPLAGSRHLVPTPKIPLKERKAAQRQKNLQFP